MNPSSFSHADKLHRLVKQALDSGVAQSIEEAEALFRQYRVGITIDSSEAALPEHQATLLTVVALGRRVFLGGVTVAGDLDVPLLVPVTSHATLGEAVTALGGIIGTVGEKEPLVTIGGGARPRQGRFHIRTTCAGWRGGIVPAYSDASIGTSSPIPLASMLSAALAVNEVFLHLNKGTPASGRRAIGLSLWCPQIDEDWLNPTSAEPELKYLPSSLWLIGLGHLGQGFLWGLGLLGYSERSPLSLVLQDMDSITPSTESTSILTEKASVGMKKTRAMAHWAEQRGFSTTIIERALDGSFRRQPQEPAIALCGIDNAVGRRALDQAGFDLVVEAGLGSGHRDFQTMRLHTLPGPRQAADIWKSAPDRANNAASQAGYRQLLRDGVLDQCGITVLAGKAVGAPFVGAVAACLALSETLRLLHGGIPCQLIDLDLQSIEQRTVISHPHDFSAFNPGYVRNDPQQHSS